MIWLMRADWSREEEVGPGPEIVTLLPDSDGLEDVVLSVLGGCVLIERNPFCLSKVWVYPMGPAL